RPSRRGVTMISDAEDEGSSTDVRIDLHHVHLVTADIRGFCDFFTTHLDAEVVFDDSIDGDRNVFLRIGSGRIHLFESKNAPAHDRNLFHHIGLLIEDLDTLVHRLRAGSRDVTDITAGPGGGCALRTRPARGLTALLGVTAEESRRHCDGDGSPAPSTEPASVREHF